MPPTDSARWIRHPTHTTPPAFIAYRLDVEMPQAATVRLRITADQRYILHVDGVETAHGPERGDRMHWFADRVDLALSKGRHRIVALTWFLSLDFGHAPRAQIGLRPEFLVEADDAHHAAFATGLAPWTCAAVPGLAIDPDQVDGAAFLAGALFVVDGGSFPAGLAEGEGLEWGAVAVGDTPRSLPANAGWGSDDARRVLPAALPRRLFRQRGNGVLRHLDAPPGAATRDVPVERARHLATEERRWTAWLREGKPLEFPPNQRRRALLDLEDYVCAYARLDVHGGPGGMVRLAWAESLFEQFGYDGVKGDRSVIDGKRFLGRHDVLHVTGRGLQRLHPPWWNCGRYIEVYVDSGPGGLTLGPLALRETRLPLEREDSLRLPLEDWPALERLQYRTLQMCAHETYMDCPYYEQLCYAGDTRLQLLVTYTTQRDASLPAKTLRLFSSSLQSDGLTASAYPASGRQIIPQFSLFWVAMLHDHLLWRGDAALIRELLPNARRVLDTFLERVDPAGGVRWPHGWNWVDWSQAWRHPGRTGPDSGNITHDASGLNAINTFQLVYVAGLLAAIERAVGDASLAERLEAIRRRIHAAAVPAFWDEARGLFADTPSRSSYSQHAQAYAILGGLLEPAQALRVADGLDADATLAPATVYFLHYVFEAQAAVGRTDRILRGLDLWRTLLRRGFVTSIERPDPSRSDCHAWGAHPIYHMHASLLGVRPASPAFGTVRVAPQPGGLSELAGILPHPSGGVIETDLRFDGETCRGTVHLPAGVPGTFVWAGTEQDLHPGANRIGPV